MSTSTARMSRRDARELLAQIRAAARKFIRDERDTSREAIRARSIIHAADSERDYLNESETNAPNARAIRLWRASIAELQADRLANSELVPPSAYSAAVVVLYGITGNTIEAAAEIAQHQLNTADVVLQDESHIRKPTLAGTRYIFLPRNP